MNRNTGRVFVGGLLAALLAGGSSELHAQRDLRQPGGRLSEERRFDRRMEREGNGARGGGDRYVDFRDWWHDDWGRSPGLYRGRPPHWDRWRDRVYGEDRGWNRDWQQRSWDTRRDPRLDRSWPEPRRWQNPRWQRRPW